MPTNPGALSEEQYLDCEWARLVEVAETWGIDPEPGLSDVMWDDEPATPAVAQYLAGQSQQQQLLCEWEDAAGRIAKLQAVQTRILAEALDLALADGASRPDTDVSVRAMAAELACAVGMSDRTIQAHMNDAQVLRDRFATTYARLREGMIARAHAQVVIDEGARLAADSVRAHYEQIVLDLPRHLTTGRLRVAAKAIAEQLMPTNLAERHAAARTLRQVLVRERDDAMAEIWALVPSVLAHGIGDRLTQEARAILDAEREAAKAQASTSDATEDESVDAVSTSPRTMDQVRADVLCDLLLTGHATAEGIDRDGGEGIDAIRAIVQITVPLAVLTAGDTGAPACLTGRGPIDPDSARRLAGNATLWDRIVIDPVTGGMVAVERRFPIEAQVRYLRARDEHCRFPGCRMPVWRCDVDHTVDHQHGGSTSVCNLAHLCRRHHTMKHHSAWKVRQKPGGVLEWTSPLGRVYTDVPSATLRFIPERE